MEQTKNITPAARRIAARTELADTLRQMAGILRRHGYEGRSLDLAATELLIGNTEIVLGQHWASDPKPKPEAPAWPKVLELRRLDAGAEPKPMFAEAGRLMRDMQPDRLLQGINAEMLETMRRDPIETGRTTVTVGAVNIPGRRDPGISLQPGADGRLAPVPAVTETMVDRAMDGWDQWWNDYKGPRFGTSSRDAMRHALEQALGVRP